jgi:protein O-mannosyl-transferase
VAHIRRKQPSVPPSGTAIFLLLAVNLLAAGLWAYATGFHGPFVFDDIPGVVENPSLDALWPPSRWVGAPPGSTPSGRPVLNFTLALNHAWGGLDVTGYHALSVVVHLLAGLALFGVVRRTLLSDRLSASFEAVASPLAFGVALLWIAHPLNTEAVTYVVQRGESLAGLFLLLTLYCSIRGWTWAAVAACALGMGSKETMIVAPALVVLWDRVFRDEGARRWRYYGALAATVVVVLLPMLSETQGRTAVSRLLGYTRKAPGDTWTAWSYLWTQAGVIVHYLALAFRPWPLVFDYYDWPAAHSPADVLPQALLLIALCGLTVYALVKKHPLGFAGAWLFLTLGPTSSLLPIPTEIAAEHRMYVPLAAVVAVVVIGLFVVARRLAGGSRAARRLATPFMFASIVLFVGLAALTRARNREYLTAVTLWADTVEKRPSNARARISLGAELMKVNRYADAESQMRATLPLEMDPASRAQTYLQLGSAVAAQRRADEGIPYLERAVAMDPSNKTADLILAQAYADAGKDALAIRQFQRALERRPEMPVLLTRSAWVLATSRDPAVRDGARAVELAEHALRVTKGQDPVVYETLAAAYAEAGRRNDAVAAVDAAIAISRATGDAQTAALYQQQRTFYAGGGKVADSPR